jgi:4-carboxymuconolactone decarboxylase
MTGVSAGDRHDGVRQTGAPLPAVIASGGARHEESRPLRITPLQEGELSERVQQVISDLRPGPPLNIHATMARHPDIAVDVVNLGLTLHAGRLSRRHREILILRTGWNCASGYVLAQHRRAALTGDMTREDLQRIRRGPSAEGWDPFEAALVRAADELHADETVSDDTWSDLTERFGEDELIEAVTLVGYYHLMSFMLNALGVPIEPGTDRFESED